VGLEPTTLRLHLLYKSHTLYQLSSEFGISETSERARSVGHCLHPGGVELESQLVMKATQIMKYITVDHACKTMSENNSRCTFVNTASACFLCSTICYTMWSHTLQQDIRFSRKPACMHMHIHACITPFLPPLAYLASRTSPMFVCPSPSKTPRTRAHLPYLPRRRLSTK
jgi:hypothetical protein